MVKFTLLALSSAVLLFAIDYYIFRNWQRFGQYRRWVRRTLPFYRVMMVIMPFVLPLYFYFSRWWEVDPKLPRALIIGFWAVYYVPKLLIALGVLVKDLFRFIIWLFGWFQKQLLTDEPQLTLAPIQVPTSSSLSSPADSVLKPDLSDMKRLSRREFLQQMGWSTASVPFVLVGYGVFKTLYDFEVYRIDVPIAGLPRALDGMTIAQLSDLHAGSFFSAQPMLEAVDYVNGLRPDLAVITGDFVNHDSEEMRVILPALMGLRTDLGVYGCLGNHDHYADVREVADYVCTTPVDLLINERRTLSVDGATLHLVGTDNTGFSQHFADLPGALSGLQEDDYEKAATILLAHDPTFWDTHVRPGHPEIDLMLCGHTHGGQIGLEAGPLRWSPARIVYERWAGLYAENRRQGAGSQFLYVNRGLGTVGPPLRLGIRPEISLLTLRRA